jgi:hypothetical protein
MSTKAVESKTKLKINLLRGPVPDLGSTSTLNLARAVASL